MTLEDLQDTKNEIDKLHNKALDLYYRLYGKEPPEYIFEDDE
jgi:hypothetical protein